MGEKYPELTNDVRHKFRIMNLCSEQRAYLNYWETQEPCDRPWHVQSRIKPRVIKTANPTPESEGE